MLFPLRQQYNNTFNGSVALGGSVSFQITRDFFLDSVLLVQPITVAGATAVTPTAAGLLGAVKRVQLNIADGQSNRNQTDMTGYGLIRHASQVLNGCDVDTLRGTAPYLASIAAASVNATYYITYPLLFLDPQLSDPIGSAFMLPLPRYNTNPTLTINYGATADMFSTLTDGTVTLGNPYLVVNKRQVDNIQFPTWETEIVERQQNYAASGANQLYEFDVPGSYTSIGLWMRTAAGVAQDMTNAPLILQYLGNTLRQSNPRDIKTRNQYSRGNDAFFTDPTSATAGAFVDYFPGVYHMDFLHDGFGTEADEMGSVLNANLLAGSGSRVQLLQSFSAACDVSYITKRVFGDLSPLKRKAV